MGGPILVPFGAGEVIGDSPERRVEILSDHESLNATWSRFGPGREGADLHVHLHHSDLFYVLAGELTVRLGPAGEPVVVPAGTLARVPPGVVHGFRNGSEAEMRYLNFHAPGRRFADYLRAIRDGREFSYDQHDPPADGGRSPSEAAIGGAVVVTDEPGLRVLLHTGVPEIEVAETWLEAATTSPAGGLVWLYVLDGELAVGGARAAAGTWVQLPPGPATLSGPARYVSVRTEYRRSTAPSG